MKNYSRELGFGLALASIFVALLAWFMFSNTQDALTVLIAVLIVLIGLVSFTWRVVKKKRDLETGSPAEDEFSKAAKVHAGSQAFEYSMYLWILIFFLILHSANLKLCWG